MGQQIKSHCQAIGAGMRFFLCKITILLLTISQLIFAAENIYQFKNLEEQTRFEKLTTNLRCLVCQNQNIAESNAPLAADLKNQIYKKIKQQQSDQQIIKFLVDRYGDFILYQPPLKLTTLLLWFGPLLFMLIAMFVLFKNIFYKKNQQE